MSPRNHMQTVCELSAAGFTPGEIEMLLLWARRLDRYNTMRCNGELTERQEKIETKTEERVEALCALRGIPCEIQGDPRGFSVVLTLPSGHSNRFAGGGWGL